MRSVDNIKEELSTIGFNPGPFVIKEVNELPNILRANEKIYAAAQGLYDGNTWLVICTNTRFIFLDKSVLFSSRQIEVPMDKVSSIQFGTGLILGHVIIWHHGQSRIDNMAKDQVKRFAEQANLAIENYKNNNKLEALTKAPNASSLKIEQLEKLDHLEDKGILTEQEFLDENKKLLAA